MRRICGTLFFVLAASAANAGTGILGTKADPIPTTPKFVDAGPGMLTILQTVVALVVILFMFKKLAPAWIGKMSKKLTTGANGMIKIEESATFAGGSLYVVQARQKTLLLSVSTQGVNCLADLTETQTDPLPPLFSEIVETEVDRQTKGDKPHFAAVLLEEPELFAAEPEATEPAEWVPVSSLLRNDEIESLRQAQKQRA